MLDLKPIKNRLAAATPGPWTVDPNASGMATVAVESSKPSLLASLADVARGQGAGCDYDRAEPPGLQGAALLRCLDV